MYPLPVLFKSQHLLLFRLHLLRLGTLIQLTTADTPQWAATPYRPSCHGGCKPQTPATLPLSGSRDTTASLNMASPSSAYLSLRAAASRLPLTRSLTRHRSALYGNERFKPYAGMSLGQSLDTLERS